jgi:hypothetical protein
MSFVRYKRQAVFLCQSQKSSSTTEACSNTVAAFLLLNTIRATKIASVKVSEISQAILKALSDDVQSKKNQQRFAVGRCSSISIITILS